MVTAEWIAVGVALCAAFGEWLHARRCRRVAWLAFGPTGKAAGWARWGPVVRVAGLGLAVWGFAGLLTAPSQVVRAVRTPSENYRHLLIALDVSPSMQLRDAGRDGGLTRARRASALAESILGRVALDRVRVSLVAFYTGAKPVVVDTYDLAVVRNALNDLPLELAFDVGKTTLLKGIEESFALAKAWAEGSAVLIVLSDGDTVPDTGMPAMPASIAQTLVIGVGDSAAGKFIDGHQSRQDAAGLRQLSARLRGAYHDGNELHVPSELLGRLSAALPRGDRGPLGRREGWVAAAASGSLALAALPVALALWGSRWQSGRRGGRLSEPHGSPGRVAVATQRAREGSQL